MYRNSGNWRVVLPPGGHRMLCFKPRLADFRSELCTIQNSIEHALSILNSFINLNWNQSGCRTALKNKGASRCHRRTFLSERFHKDPLTSEEPFSFTNSSLWWKKVLQIIKKVRKRWFFKESLTEWVFVEPKMVLLWHRLKNILKGLFLRMCNLNLKVRNN